ncbi:MAG: GTP cyclohydrolase I FolE [Candidatus Binatia bacterium]|nr:GTP cyclohydrolase I FolE [Candidatus Binatia bacterium]
MVDTPDHADIIFDDLVDTGETLKRYQSHNKLSAVLFDKRPPDSPRSWLVGSIAEDNWLVFPWEASEEKSADDIPIRLLQYIGEDPTRGGLKETPARFLKAWREWTEGYGINPSTVLKHFEDGAEKVDEMVLLKDIPVFSHCEHHLAPFFGVAHVGYIPNGKIVGLSKLSRLVDVFAHRLQVQERLTIQIADALNECLNPKGVAVVLECRHMCMESRGIRRSGATTMTSAMRGVMLSKPEARAEFLSLIKE